MIVTDIFTANDCHVTNGAVGTVSVGARALPLAEAVVPAGFPSPSPDIRDMPLNIHDYVVKNSTATYFVRVSGSSMIGAGIYPDDILVVDRSITPRHGHIVIAAVDGDMTVKRLFRKDGKIMLMPENKHFAPIVVHDGQELDIWGVVTFVVHRTMTASGFNDKRKDG